MTNNDTRISLDRYASKGDAITARRLVRTALELGYSISVQDGEEWTVKQSRDRMAILSAMATTGMDRLRFRDSEGNKLGTMLLVYGNALDGSELIADYQDNDAMNALYAMVTGG